MLTPATINAYFSIRRNPGVVFRVPERCPFHPNWRAISSVSKAYDLFVLESGSVDANDVYLCGDTAGTSENIESGTLSEKNVATLSSDFSDNYFIGISVFEIDFGPFCQLPFDCTIEFLEDF